MNGANRRDGGTRSRQNLLLLVLALALLLGGLIVLAFLDRMPTPLRLVVSSGDFVASAALLLLLFQRTRRP